ncbi:hypothetical protein ALTERO38_50926 [Alteromonas sp. 38]|nr:hypothetical protein ALTER154_70108 [Alteromonas sp. 154]VXB53726.1 hypothetical protein ALTERO38_50926 [Alteromonas sp. 38]
MNKLNKRNELDYHVKTMGPILDIHEIEGLTESDTVAFLKDRPQGE